MICENFIYYPAPGATTQAKSRWCVDFEKQRAQAGFACVAKPLRRARRFPQYVASGARFIIARYMNNI